MAKRQRGNARAATTATRPRTIADLAEERDITAAHVSEAIQYRSLDRVPCVGMPAAPR